MFVVDEDDYLSHYGILRRSGRYPWGSGGEDENDAVGRSRDFLGMVEELRKKGFTESQIAESFSDKEKGIIFTTTELRATVSIARNQKRAADIAMAERLKTKGYSNQAIAERMGLAGESSVRALLDPGAKTRTDELTTISDFLKDQMKEKGYIDVGVGVEHDLAVSRTKLDVALSMLKSEGYEVVNVQAPQVANPNQKTTIKVLCPPGMSRKEHYIALNQDLNMIKTVAANKTDDDKIVPIYPPLSINSKRVGIKYGDEGGAEADGVIYVRPGVPDISLGKSQYAQVRIAVDGTHYLKGMAVYKDDLPDGVDLQFNTNKNRADAPNKLDALKPMKDDPVDPFGAVTRQLLGADGKPSSVMNIVNEEGDWAKWSKNLASQMLSKQKPSLAKEQLGKAYSRKKEELDEILALTNPAVRRKLLQSYSDDADSAAVHLKAAAMDRQATQVIMPVRSLKETEIYAPNFNDGERVALVRYPHGGTFEIPELTVNNKNPEAVSLLGRQAKDAVGINHKVAERLSGADFDGDTVLVIPNNAGKIKSKPALEALKGFDPKVQYKAYEGMPRLSEDRKQNEMGQISNLITDMTIKGANDHEIARAVKHSMVVIDAAKHNLNYRQSALDNNIPQLKAKYQGGARNGSTTLISRTGRDIRVPERKQSFRINPDTGEKEYHYTGATYVDKQGRVVPKTTKSKEGAEAKNAYDITSDPLTGGTPIERIYADHANGMKGLANKARREMVMTKSIPYSPAANKVYAKEVRKLDADLLVALKNAPKERQAQVLANAIVKQKRDANPDMASDELKKIKGKALTEARQRVGAGKNLVPIDDDQWEAIQAGAITNNKLKQILNNTDLDRVKELATPRQATVMTATKQARAQSLLNSGRTPAEVANILGVPLSTLKSSLTREEG